jgi:hypothetical protein
MRQTLDEFLSKDVVEIERQRAEQVSLLEVQICELETVEFLIKDRRTVREALQYIEIRRESLERKKKELIR